MKFAKGCWIACLISAAFWILPILAITKAMRLW